MKPYSEACERNQGPILKVLREVYNDRRKILEIASGTGQHAVYFGAAMPGLIWQTSDLPVNHAGISAWINEARLPNVRAPLSLDANANDWPPDRYDGIFIANAVHIMSGPSVVQLFANLGRVIEDSAVLCLYGPFNYRGRFTSASNQAFDEALRIRDPESGIRDFEKLDQLAGTIHLKLWQDIEMPSNNRCLVWRRG